MSVSLLYLRKIKNWIDALGFIFEDSSEIFRIIVYYTIESNRWTEKKII